MTTHNDAPTVARQQCGLGAAREAAVRLRQSGLFSDAKLADRLDALSTVTPAEAGGLVDAQTEARAIVEEYGKRPKTSILINLIATALAAKDAELASLREFERQHDYCCCGSRMADHDIGSGHSPVSVFDYEYGRAVERAEAAEAALAEARKDVRWLLNAFQDEREGFLGRELRDRDLPPEWHRAARRAREGGRDA